MTKKLKLLLCLSAFAVCTSLASADTFSDLISNLNSLMKNQNLQLEIFQKEKNFFQLFMGIQAVNMIMERLDCWA